MTTATIDRPAFLDGGPKRNLIGGTWREASSGRTFATANPADGAELARIAEGDARDVDLAVAAARRAFEGSWSRMRPAERQRILLRLADAVERHADELSLLDTLDMGAPFGRTRYTVRRAADRFRWFAAQAMSIHGETPQNSLTRDFLSYTLKEPVGVVGAITPWNGPVAAAAWKIGPVLASGCTMVLKPAEETPLSTLRLGELCLEAGVPEGVVNIVAGFGETAGAALAAHMDVDKIAFTGSHETGQAIVRASAGNLKRLSLELGGKSPDIVLGDADLDAAVPGAAMAIFNNSGQVCSAGSRLLVERGIYDEFVARVAEFGSGLRVGNGLDDATQIGPLVSERQLERVTRYLAIGRDEGARAVTGGARATDGELAKGFFVAPTVFAGVRNEMTIAQDEIFGPVLAAIPFDSEEEAARIANASRFGLASGVWTRDVGRAHRLARLLRTGTVWVNSYHVSDPAVPFGGTRFSGYGRESGIQQIEEYLSVKSVWIPTD